MPELRSLDMRKLKMILSKVSDTYQCNFEESLRCMIL